MHIQFCLSKATIKAVCFPVYGFIRPDSYQAIFPTQRRSIVKLSFRSGEWRLAHDIPIDKDKITSLINLCHDQYPLATDWSYYGITDGSTIEWLSAYRDNVLIANPHYSVKYDRKRKILSSKSIEKKCHPDNMVYLFSNRYIILNSPLFSDFFTFVLFDARGNVNDNLIEQFHQHLLDFKKMIYGKHSDVMDCWYSHHDREKVIQMRDNALRFISVERRRKINVNNYEKSLRDVIIKIRNELVKELVYIYANKDIFVRLRACGTIINLLMNNNGKRRNISKSVVLRTILSANNFHKYIIIEYIQYRSKIIKRMPPRYNPFLLAGELIIRD